MLNEQVFRLVDTEDIKCEDIPNIIVLGGTKGIGLETVKALAYKYPTVNVYAVGRNLPEFSKDVSRNIIFTQSDLDNNKSVDDLIYSFKRNLKRIDCIVNCCSKMIYGNTFSQSYDEVLSMMDLNCLKPYKIYTELLHLLKNANGASIINISSVSSTYYNSSIGYSLSKSALNSLTKFMAKDLAKCNIRMNSINLGFTNTGFQVNQGILSTVEYQEKVNEMDRKIPLGVGSINDVIPLILFLSDKNSSWMTGSIIDLDGGQLL